MDLPDRVSLEKLSVLRNIFTMEKHIAIAFVAGLLSLSFGGDTSAQLGQLPRLTNVSTRMKVLTGEDVMIAGFVVGGTTHKTVAVIATGPSLKQYGIANALSNPTLTLVRSSDQATIATNDDWQTAPNAPDLESAGLAPSDPLEPAILLTLAPGAYTAIVSGVGGATGVAVAAAYEVGQPEAPLINISTRGKVLTGTDVMIGGFVVNGTSPKDVTIVATGPSLAQFGISNPLADPTLRLVRSADNAVISTNDNWETHASAGILAINGLAPESPYEAGMVVTLAPGAYTAILSGVGNTTGTAVLGIYESPGPADWPPRLVSSLPLDLQSQVAVTTSVTMKFDKPLDPATFNKSTVELVGPKGAVAGTVLAIGDTATFTPTERLLTESTFTAKVSKLARGANGRGLLQDYSFKFRTKENEPPPIVAGCPAPEPGSEVRFLDYPAPPKNFFRGNGYVTSFRLPRPGSIRFLEGVIPAPSPKLVELTISRCPGVIQSNLHQQCRVTTQFSQFIAIAAVDRPLTDDQGTAQGCLAPSSEQYYVNMRWTCTEQQCGQFIQWQQ